TARRSTHDRPAIPTGVHAPAPLRADERRAAERLGTRAGIDGLAGTVTWSSMDPLLDKLDPDDRKRLRRAAMPAFTPPMLATLTKQVLSDPVWVYEPKLDGQRSLLWRRGSTVRLITRNEKDRTSHYPDLTGAILRDETPPLMADGEIVAFDGDVTSFSRLQARMQNARPSTVQIAAVPVYFYLFDLIWFDGYDL